jgi:hypothetical protein
MKTTRYFFKPILLPLFMFTACGQTKIKGQYRKSIAMGNSINKPGNPYYSIQTLKKKRLVMPEKERFYQDVYEVSCTQIPKDLYRKILGHR